MMFDNDARRNQHKRDATRTRELEEERNGVLQVLRSVAGIAVDPNNLKGAIVDVCDRVASSDVVGSSGRLEAQLLKANQELENAKMKNGDLEEKYRRLKKDQLKLMQDNKGQKEQLRKQTADLNRRALLDLDDTTIEINKVRSKYTPSGRRGGDDMPPRSTPGTSSRKALLPKPEVSKTPSSQKRQRDHAINSSAKSKRVSLSQGFDVKENSFNGGALGKNLSSCMQPQDDNTQECTQS